MARNVEIKAWLRDRAGVEHRAAMLADQPPQRIDQDDTFYGRADGRLKLRRLGPDLGELIAYARADTSGPGTSDYEITRTTDPDGLGRALARAYPVAGRVVKQRTLYLVGRTRIHLDVVEGLGDLMELEVVLGDDEDDANGTSEAEALMNALGIDPADLVDRAYVDLLADRDEDGRPADARAATAGTTAAAASAFLSLHRPGQPLLCPNPWDAGSARILASLGFAALATTSSGFASTLGRRDGTPSPDEVFGNAATIVSAASPVPVTADLEDGYGADLAGVAATIARAVETGLAGASIEDWSGTTIRGAGEAAARVAAAAAAAGDRLVITARAENHFRGRDDLGDTIERLLAYEAAGAHVLYAPGLIELDQIRRVVDAVARPVNVLLRPGGPTVAQLADVGVARVTVGGSFHYAALGALVEAAAELRADTSGWTGLSAVGQSAAHRAFTDR